MRTVTYGINCTFEDNASSGSFNHNDRNGFLRRCVGVGSADNAQNISSFTIPPVAEDTHFFRPFMIQFPPSSLATVRTPSPGNGEAALALPPGSVEQNAAKGVPLFSRKA